MITLRKPRFPYDPSFFLVPLTPKNIQLYYMNQNQNLNQNQNQNLNQNQNQEQNISLSITDSSALNPQNIIMNNTTEYVNELYDKLTYLDMYGSTVVLFICLTLFVFCIYTYCQALQKKEALVNDWANQRCKPQYIPFAGYINSPDGKSAFDYTGENFQYCMQNILVNITGNALKPIELLLAGVTNFFSMLSGTINQIRTVLSILRDNVANFVQEILHRLLITIIPLQTIMIKVMDMFNKIQGIMMGSLYTILGAYVTLKSLMGAMMELVIRVLVIMTIIIVGLWASGPAFWTAAAGASVSYLAISIPLALVLFFMSDVLHIKTSAIPKLRRCFDGCTLIKMYDGTFKKISNVEPGQLLENGIKVTSKFKVDASNLKMFELHDIIVSETHIVKYNGKWIQIGDHPDSKKEIIYNKPFLYCLNTNSKEITINGTTFSDWDELYGEELDNVLHHISSCKEIHNPNDRENIHRYLEIGFESDTYVYLSDNTKKPIKYIKIGDKLSTKGTVYGIVEILNKNPKSNEKVFHLLTTNKLFEIDGKVIRDYNDAVDSICQSMNPRKSHFNTSRHIKNK
jgi:hypothetical protein